MGNLGAPFILCPLSDRKELLGMAEDKGKVILTIGKNMAIRYDMLEQKQETSWTTSRHWFTSPVIFSKDLLKYAAVLDNRTLAMWEEGDTSLANVYKTKYGDTIWGFVPTSKATLMVFNNGFMTYLPSEREKDLATGRGYIEEGQIIFHVANCEESGHIVLLWGEEALGTQAQKRNGFKVGVFSSSCVLEGRMIIEEETLGYCVMGNGTLLYLCQDGRLLQRSLVKDELTRVAGQLEKFVSLKFPVVLSPVDSSTIVVYGSDPCEEGATVFLYDLKYDLVMSKQGLKMYGTPAIMHKIGSSVLIPVGLHILVISIRISQSLLSDVVGKHGLRAGDEVILQREPFMLQQSWEEFDKDGDTISSGVGVSHGKKKQKKKAAAADDGEDKRIKKTFPEFWEVVQQTKLLEKEGQPQSLICSQVVPLALNKEAGAIEWVLDSFTDIPEPYLVSFLSNRLQKGLSSSMDRDDQLEKLIAHRVDITELVGALESLDYSHVCLFLQYLRTRMEQVINGFEDGSLADYIPWISSLIDSHYPKFVLYGEKALIEQILLVVDQSMKLMEAIGELQPFLLLLRDKVDNYTPRTNAKSKWRTETVNFV